MFCALSLLLSLIEFNSTSAAAIGFIIIFTVAVFLYKTDKLNHQSIILLVFAAGMLLRLQYVLYTGCTERQHDVELFGSGQGHAGYIEYIYANFGLPNFDVREVWQFYHPPLHHIISAGFLRLLTECGVEYTNACESLQILSLFYSALCMLIGYRILQQFNLSQKTISLCFSILAFHPTFIIFAGSINNDILSITFQLAAIYYTLKWYNNRKTTDIVKIAFCIGLGMMTKLSSWMVAPAVAFVFLYAMICDLKSKRSKFSFYLKQYSAFAVICIPLGLWWSVRNYLLYAVPVNYIPLLEVDNPQYIGYHSAIRRLFDFGLHQFEYVFDMWGNPYFEYNPTIGLLKTSMFGESVNSFNYPQIEVWGIALFWIGAILAVLSIVAILYWIIKNKGNSSLFNIFLLITFFINLVMYYYFCLSFEFTCTQNIRYATPLIVIGIVFIGELLNKCEIAQSKFSVIVKNAIYSLVGLFCVFSSITYVLLGI